MNNTYQKYRYDGPIMEYSTCVANNWSGETVAPSEKKARNNLAYQYKKQNNRNPNVQVTLPGKIKAIS